MKAYNNREDIILNKKNISNIYNKILKSTSINPNSNDSKNELISKIVNELKIISPKINDKLINKTDIDLNSIFDKSLINLIE